MKRKRIISTISLFFVGLIFCSHRAIAGGAWGFEGDEPVRNFIRLVYSMNDRRQCPNPALESERAQMQQWSRILINLDLLSATRAQIQMGNLSAKDKECLSSILLWAENLR